MDMHTEDARRIVMRAANASLQQQQSSARKGKQAPSSPGNSSGYGSMNGNHLPRPAVVPPSQGSNSSTASSSSFNGAAFQQQQQNSPGGPQLLAGGHQTNGTPPRLANLSGLENEFHKVRFVICDLLHAFTKCLFCILFPQFFCASHKCMHIPFSFPL